MSAIPDEPSSGTTLGVAVGRDSGGHRAQLPRGEVRPAC